MRKYLLIAAGLLAAAGGFYLTIQGDSARADGHVRITGSSTVAPVVAELARAFERQNPSVRVDVEAGGSARGLTDVRRGLADIGMVSRAIRPEDDVTALLLARDGVAIIVHADNPMGGLTRADVRGLYDGSYRRWTALGGPDLPVTLVHKADGRATQAVFLEYTGLDNSAIAPDAVVGHNEQAIRTVAANPGAMGYVSIGAAKAAIADGVSIRLPALDGVEASVAAVAAGRFPMARELNLVTRGKLSEAARRFLDFAHSHAARPLIEEESFVPAGP